jgi:hypothetical protein
MDSKNSITPVKKRAPRRDAQNEGARAKFPRHPVGKALRVAKAILEQNAGKACTPEEAAAFVGVGPGGQFNVEIGSATKYGFLERPQTGQIQPTTLAKKILRPQAA